MVKKSSLAKKLASYSAVAAVLVADKNASAQIVYTNLNPYDTIGPDYNHFYQLDLNNDGIYDFDFNYKSFSGESYYERFEHHYSIVSCGEVFTNSRDANRVYGSTFRNFLNYGDTISSKLKPWYGRTIAEINCYALGCFSGDTGTQYIGFTISKDKYAYYGWARVKVEYSPKFFVAIESYAYNNTPDSPIYAGVECTPNYYQPSLKINNDTLGTNAGSSIQWYVNDQPISGDTTQKITMSQYGFYQVREGDTTQCYTESTTFNYIDCSAYKPNIGPTPLLLCNYDNPPTLTIDTIPPEFSVQWYNDDTLVPQQNGKSLYTQYIPGVKYTENIYALVYESNGCYDTTNTVRITYDTLTANLNVIQHGDTLFAEDNKYRFPFSVKYQWYDNYGLINGATSYYYVVQLSGTYSVEITDSNSCSNGFNDYDVEGINLVHRANIFIAESNNLLNIKFNEVPYNGYKLVIYNYIGQQVYTTEITSGNMMIDLSSLAKGLYLVTLEKDNSRVVKKIVLQ